jgi:hypothetical protein
MARSLLSRGARAQCRRSATRDGLALALRGSPLFSVHGQELKVFAEYAISARDFVEAGRRERRPPNRPLRTKLAFRSEIRNPKSRLQRQKRDPRAAAPPPNDPRQKPRQSTPPLPQPIVPKGKRQIVHASDRLRMASMVTKHTSSEARARSWQYLLTRCAAAPSPRPARHAIRLTETTCGSHFVKGGVEQPCPRMTRDAAAIRTF